jgi:hypothetical protein
MCALRDLQRRLNASLMLKVMKIPRADGTECSLLRRLHQHGPQARHEDVTIRSGDAPADTRASLTAPGHGGWEVGARGADRLDRAARNQGRFAHAYCPGTQTRARRHAIPRLDVTSREFKLYRPEAPPE